MSQSRYNQLLEEEFDKCGKLIAIGEPLTQSVWDRIIHCANLAADRYATETAIDALKQATQWKTGLDIILK